MKTGYWCVTSIIGAFFKLFHSHRVYGLENIPKGPAIIAPNHVSFYDPPLISCSFPEELHYLAKEELFDYTFLRWLISNLNAHPVSGSEKDLKTMKLICQLLEKGEKVVIFPEGSRSHDDELLDLKLGVSMLAFRNHVPIIPVYLKGSFEIWPIQNKWPKFSGKTTCTIGKPIAPEQFAGLGKREAQLAMTEALRSALIDLQTG